MCKACGSLPRARQDECTATCSISGYWVLFKSQGSRSFCHTWLSQVHSCSTWTHCVCIHQDSSSFLYREVTADLGHLGRRLCWSAQCCYSESEILDVTGEVLECSTGLVFVHQPHLQNLPPIFSIFSPSKNLHLPFRPLCFFSKYFLFSSVCLLFLPDWEPIVFPVWMVYVQSTVSHLPPIWWSFSSVFTGRRIQHVSFLFRPETNKIYSYLHLASSRLLLESVEVGFQTQTHMHPFICCLLAFRM